VAEIELLPHWYAQARYRRRLLVVQCVATAILLSLLGVVGFLRRHTVWETRNQVSILETNLAESRQSVQQLALARQELEQLQARQRIYQRLGPQVNPNRILSAIAGAMPGEASLTSFELSVEEQPVNVSATERASDRRLRIRLAGIAPSDGAVGQLIEKLDRVPVFNNVQLAFVRGKTDICREFDLNFSINLGRRLQGSTGPASGGGAR
jgi:Tfp pilus assembly protein PilN